MPRLKLETYVERHGEDEGRRRWEAAQSVEDADAPLDRLQEPHLPEEGGETAPKRPASPRARTTSRQPTAREVTAAMATAVYLADQAAQYLVPSWREESLTHEEIGRLGEALGGEVMDHPKLLKMFVSAEKNGVHLKLAYVVASIALPRLQRRGLVPEGLPGVMDEQHDATGDALPVEPGGAHGPDRDDRVGQIDAGEPAAGAAAVRADPALEVRPGGVPEHPAGFQGGRNGRPTGLPVGALAELQPADAGVQ